MSGGSFNYPQFKADDSTDIFKGLYDYHSVEEFLRGQGKHDAADEVLKFILAVETAQRRLMVMGKRIAPLLEAADRAGSYDTSIGAVDMAFAELDVTQA